ncbi:MAG: DNA polymerase III subunit gamma/tau, partial [Pirellulales bacterium]
MSENATSENTGEKPQHERPKEYVVVARRYRPQQFEELIGQEHVAGALANAIETNRTGHAYLFTGARGVGKTSAARILAKALNCVTGPTTHPCGKCEVCLDVSSGHDVDVLEIDGASNRGIDEIRQLRQNVNIRPSRARFKIYIIDEVHMLTREAFNALLKTLEEPPEHVKFIFCTTEPNKIPITVLSRCQRFDFAGIQTDSIERRLEQIVESEGLEAESEALAILARRAGGSMRDSQSLLEQLLASTDKKLTAAGVHALLGTADDGRLVELAEAVIERNASAALAALDAAIMAAIDVGQFLEQLLGVFRDMMAVKVGCGDEQLLSFAGAEARAKVRQLAEGVSLETVLAMLQILDATLARFRVTTQRRTLAEMAVVRLANLGDLQDLGDLLAQAAQGNEIRLSTGGAQAPASPSSSAPSTPPAARPAQAVSQPPQSPSSQSPSSQSPS